MIAKSLLIGSAIALLVVTPLVGANHDTDITAKQITRLEIEDQNDELFFTGTTNVQVTGSSSINIGTSTGIFVVTFTAESVCYGSSDSWCSIILRCDGIELFPQAGADFAFDSTGPPVPSNVTYHSLTVTRRSAGQPVPLALGVRRLHDPFANPRLIWLIIGEPARTYRDVVLHDALYSGLLNQSNSDGGKPLLGGACDSDAIAARTPAAVFSPVRPCARIARNAVQSV